jgi:hypothetical protein
MLRHESSRARSWHGKHSADRPFDHVRRRRPSGSAPSRCCSGPGLQALRQGSQVMHFSGDDPFEASRPAEELIRALCAADRDDVVRSAGRIAPLIEHWAPEVRAEALSALFVIGRSEEYRSRALRALSRDADEGVRAKAAYAVAATSNDGTLSDDVRLLLRALQNERESPEVRRAVYEALLLIFKRAEFPDPLEDFNPETDVDWIWINEIETLYE